MAKIVDIRGRETEILNLVVETYIKETKPISSIHLCEKYSLPYSSATIRNVMENLEKKGFLSHIHTSSGRVPTTKGFKRYVESLKQEEMVKNYPLEPQSYNAISNSGQVINNALDILAKKSGYASFLAVSGQGHKLFFRGDVVEFKIKLSFIVPGKAFIRTNIGRGLIAKEEIIGPYCTPVGCSSTIFLGALPFLKPSNSNSLMTIANIFS